MPYFLVVKTNLFQQIIKRWLLLYLCGIGEYLGAFELQKYVFNCFQNNANTVNGNITKLFLVYFFIEPIPTSLLYMVSITFFFFSRKSPIQKFLKMVRPPFK